MDEADETQMVTLALDGAGLLALPDARAQPSHTVSSEQLQAAVAQRFPMRYPVGELLDLTLQAPRLHMLSRADACPCGKVAKSSSATKERQLAPTRREATARTPIPH